MISGSPYGQTRITAPCGALPSWHGQALPVVTAAASCIAKADFPLPAGPPIKVSLPRAIRPRQSQSTDKVLSSSSRVTVAFGPTGAGLADWLVMAIPFAGWIDVDAKCITDNLAY